MSTWYRLQANQIKSIDISVNDYNADDEWGFFILANKDGLFYADGKTSWVNVPISIIAGTIHPILFSKIYWSNTDFTNLWDLIILK